MVSLEPPVSSLNCFGRCCKWLLYAFNILFMFSGIAAMAVGVWAILDPTSYRIVVLTNTRMYVIAAIILIGAGAAATFVAIIGCCGARYENRCLIVSYAMLLLLIFVAEFSSGTLALAYYVQIETFANAEMRDAVVDKYGQGNHIETTDAYDYMQSRFACCGFNSTGHDAAQLYQVSVWYRNSIIQVPPSCCKRNEDGEPINQEKCQNRYEKGSHDLTFVNNIGCRKAVMEQGERYATILAGTGIGLSLLQLIGMALAFCLSRRI